MKIISTKTFRDWSSIPSEILILIAGKIVSADDYVRFSAACRSWYSIAADFHRNQNPQFVPLFVSGIDPESSLVTFRNPASNSTFTLHSLRADLRASMMVEPALHSPETRYRIWGSPFGWLIVHDRCSGGQCLLNPFTGATIPLPSFSTCEWIKSTASFLTASPDSDPDNCLVILVYGKGSYGDNIYMYRPFGDNKVWRSARVARGVADFAFFEGNLYGITPYSEFGMSLQQFDYRNEHRYHPWTQMDINSMEINLTPHNAHMGSHVVTQEHLFELNGELCLCLRFYNLNRSVTNEFKIFKIDVSSGDLEPLLSLGDHCLFLGNNYSFACKASYPRDKVFERDGCNELVSDYVFFSYRHNLPVKDYYNRPFDVEVWDMLRSRKICRKRDARNSLCESLWIVPSINLRKLEDDEECVK